MTIRRTPESDAEAYYDHPSVKDHVALRITSKGRAALARSQASPSELAVLDSLSTVPSLPQFVLEGTLAVSNATLLALSKDGLIEAFIEARPARSYAPEYSQDDFDFDYQHREFLRLGRFPNPERESGGESGGELLQEFATNIAVSDNFSRLDLSLDDAAFMLADFAVRTLGPLVAKEAELSWAVKALRDHTPVTDAASATKAVERARYAADYVLGRSELAQVRRPEECASALRAIAEVCVEARYTPSKTSDACLEAMEKAMACGVPADKVANAARRFLGQALRPQAVKPEFVPAAPRTSILSSFRSMFSSSPSARAANPNSIYSVAVDGRPFYSSHLRDQAMRRFMQKRSSGRGEVTLSIDGDVAYRAASGGAVRVGNPLSGRTPNHHRTGILSEDYPIDPYNKDLDKAYDPYDRYWRVGNPVGNSVAQPQKYPRTFHLPWSQGSTDDDKTHSFEDIERMFGGKEVVITEKMDGENTTIYSTGECHARSLDSGRHPSRDYVKSKAREIACMGLPEGWRIMGENLYARHSIEYDLLPDYFVIFGVADEDDYARPWDEVEEWAELLEVPHAPVVWRGVWDTEKVMDLYPFKSMLSSTAPSEGYVVRLAGAFPMGRFDENVAKFVRRGHVQPDAVHWMHQKIVPNRRRNGR